MFATAYHRTVIFECDASVSDDGEVLAAQQQRLMQHYQPDGGHTPVTTEHAMYRGAFKEIRALTLTVRARKVKWKLGQNRKPEQLHEGHRRVAQARPDHGRRARPMRCNGRWIARPQ